METNNQKDYDIDLVSLLSTKQKISKINLETRILEINSKTEQMSLTIRAQEKKNICYKGLYIIKGDIYPIPKINDIIIVNEVKFQFDDNFNLGFFVKITKSNDMNYIDSQEKSITLDFTANNIIKTLKETLNINETLYSKIFIINDDSCKDYFIIKSLENNIEYRLIKNQKLLEYSLEKNDIIYIFNYYEYKDKKDNKNYIGLTLITLVSKLNEEELFFLLEKNIDNQNKYFLGKVVEINDYNKERRIILLDENKKIFKLLKKDENIKLGQLFLLTNYKILINGDEIPIIEETEKSFTYLSSQDIYFSNKIKLNKFSIIQFHFLDFNMEKKNNLYNAIKINEKITDIVKNEMNIIVESKRIKNFEYYPLSIQLMAKGNKKKSENVEFIFNLFHGFLNKINAFINFKPKIPYFYEYLYYYCDSSIYQAKKSIKINKSLYCIMICDIFDSSNRLRFNILNIPFQEECNQKLLGKSNSLMICEVFSEKCLTPEIMGIFNIDEINSNIPKLNSNNIFDKYYNDFGFIYNYLSDFSYKNIDSFVNICQEKYKHKIFSEKNLDFKNVGNYEEEISLSQFKTRIGIIVSYYLSASEVLKKEDSFWKIKHVFSNIYCHKNNLSLMQFLRLFKFLLKKLLIKHEVYEICFISNLDEFSPYLAAYNFNIDEINKINEYSRLFMAYLQIDSYILSNFLLKDSKSYSLSIIPLFIIRNHLLQTYEGFFLIEDSNNNLYAQSITDEKITIINIKKIFEFSNIIKMKDIERIVKPNILKNHAFSVSMEFRHENNSHHKKNQKNRRIASPIYYFDKRDTKKIEYLKNNNIQGEDGRLIEAFIDENRENIISLHADIIYGDLLDINLFIQRDFKELKEKMNKIRQKKDKFGDKIDEPKINKNKIEDDLNIAEKYLYNEKGLEKEYIELKRTGSIMISDEEYTEELIKEIIETARKNNTFEQLPIVIIYIDKRMKEDEDENDE